MGKEESPQVSKRTTRSTVFANTPSKKASDLRPPPSIRNDLIYGQDEPPISLDTLVSNFPGRRPQILDLLRLVGPSNCPMLPLFVYGGPSTGKTSLVLQTFRHLKRPFIYSSFRTCYNARIFFESTLSQLFLHRRNAGNGYSTAKRCEKPADFVCLLREGLKDVINSIDGVTKKTNSKELVKLGGTGRMVYFVFDNMELVRDWDKHSGAGSGVISTLFKLYDILKMPEVGLIFISNASPDTYYSNAGCVDSVPVYFPDYTEDDLYQILMKDQAKPKVYSSFLDIVLKPFVRITRRVDELSITFQTLFDTYCQPLSDTELIPSEDTKRKLFTHLKSHIAPSLNEVFKVHHCTALEVEANKEKVRRKGNARNIEEQEASDAIDFHMSVSAKYLLISAFLASRNPATLDASLFDSTGGGDNRKRKRKSSEASTGKKEKEEQDLVMKGPGTFPLERLLAIFQCITSVTEGSFEEEQREDASLGSENREIGLMSDVLLQLSTLCNGNFISKGGSCPLEASTRYQCTVSEEMILKVARSVKFPLSKYLYRR